MVKVGNIIGAALNIFTFTLLLVATIGSWWSWGYIYPQRIAIPFGASPWVISQVYNSEFPIPCLEECDRDGLCKDFCYPNYDRVFWSDLTAENACRPGSQIYITFSGPLGYCHFAENATVPGIVAPDAASDLRWAPPGEDPLPGTQFIQPATIPAMQGLIVTATVLAFLAIVFGFAQISAVAAFLSFVVFVLTVAAFALWINLNYTIYLLDHNIRIPVWTMDKLNLVTVETQNNERGPWYGASFGTAIAAAVLAFIAMILHIVALAEPKKDKKKETPAPTPAPAQPVPAQAEPAQTVIVEAPAAAAAPTQEVSKV